MLTQPWVNIESTLNQQCWVNIVSTLLSQPWVNLESTLSQHWVNNVDSTLTQQSWLNFDSTILTQPWVNFESTCLVNNVESTLSQRWVNIVESTLSQQCWVNLESTFSHHWINNVESTLSQQCWVTIESTMLSQHWVNIEFNIDSTMLIQLRLNNIESVTSVDVSDVLKTTTYKLQHTSQTEEDWFWLIWTRFVVMRSQWSLTHGEVVGSNPGSVYDFPTLLWMRQLLTRDFQNWKSLSKERRISRIEKFLGPQERVEFPELNLQNLMRGEAGFLRGQCNVGRRKWRIENYNTIH